jgi:hypothetical protein
LVYAWPVNVTKFIVDIYRIYCATKCKTPIIILILLIIIIVRIRIIRIIR